MKRSCIPSPSKALKVAAILAAVFLPSLPSYGHIYGYNYQEWRNDKYHLLIQFATDPQTPSVGTNSTLLFSVQDLRTGEHLKNFTETVTISYYGGSDSSNNIDKKYSPTPVSDGDFSHRYVFARGGTYEVFLRVDTPTFINVSKFSVFVSSPQFQAMNMFYILLPVIVVVAIFAGVGLAIARYLYKKR